MSTTTQTAAEPAPSHIEACACHLYDAQCALHAAHQSEVEEWIAAAAERLHEAVIPYLAATRDDKRARAQKHGMSVHTGTCVWLLCDGTGFEERLAQIGGTRWATTAASSGPTRPWARSPAAPASARDASTATSSALPRSA